MVSEARLMRIAVTKMHGAENDFVVVDRRDRRDRNLFGFVNWVCHRHHGVGADGVIAIESSAVADARMRTINADGSEAEMCGNGIRCAARWLDEAGAGTGDRLTFETDAGLIGTEIVARGEIFQVRVEMGVPNVQALAVPRYAVAWYVDVGNPHVVLLCSDVDAEDLERVAQALQRDERFASGTNVHVMAKYSAGIFNVRHWERGVGLTNACGTGAVACAAAAISAGMASSPVELVVPGGLLHVEWEPGQTPLLTGPARRVFDTVVDAGDTLRD
jgi:diaminopimelate epimerase